MAFGVNGLPNNKKSIFDDYPNPPVSRVSTAYYSDLKSLELSQLDRLRENYPRYGRFGTPTTDALENEISTLEGAYKSIAVCSGLAAIAATIMSFARAGSHIIASSTVYHPTRSFLSELGALGVEVEFIPAAAFARLSDHIRENTSLVFVECPGSNVFDVPDLAPAINSAKLADVPFAVDASWSTPIGLSPLAMGADVSIHSASKYICGNSDAILGLISCNEDVYPSIRTTTMRYGYSAGAEETYSVLRGLKTLRLRMAYQIDSALKIAAWLSDCDVVKTVLRPDLPSHPDNELFHRYFSASNGLISFSLPPCNSEVLNSAFEMMTSIKLGFGWGGTQSLIVPFSSVDSRYCSKNESFFRLSVGLEETEELILDLTQVFDQIVPHID